jgi:hypothetical protein
MKKITSLFQDKLFIIFLIFVFLFYIIFYQYISLGTKKEIYDTLSKPIVFVTVLCLLMFILYNHLTIGIILILAFLLSLTYGDTQKRQQDALKARKEQKKQQQQQQQQQQHNSNNLFNINKQDKHYDIQINKDFVTDAYNNKIYKNGGGGNGPNDEGFTDFIGDTIKGLTNQLREGIKANKKFEKELNTGDVSLDDNDNDNDNDNDDDDDDNDNDESLDDDDNDNDEDNEDDDDKSNKHNKHKKKSNARQREDFTRILKRRFDLSDDDDKRLVYSKKILESIVNRINYKYDDKKYLKKYIGSKIEDIVDTLDLLDDDDD